MARCIEKVVSRVGVNWRQRENKRKKLESYRGFCFNLSMAAIAFLPLFGSGIINSSSTKHRKKFIQ